MSRAFWRSILTCLLLVALPFSGFASTRMLGCGSAHEHAPMTDHHGTPATAEVAGMATDQASHFDGAHQCGNCAPCSLGAALFGDVKLRLTPTPPVADFPAADARYRSAWLGTLDRPPRPLFA